MKDSLRQQFERLALRLNELDATLADPGVTRDMKRYRERSREHAEVAGLVTRFRRFERREYSSPRSPGEGRSGRCSGRRKCLCRRDRA